MKTAKNISADMNGAHGILSIREGEAASMTLIISHRLTIIDVPIFIFFRKPSVGLGPPPHRPLDPPMQESW